MSDISKPLLHIFFPAACEVASAQTVRAVKYDGVGISLDSSQSICIAVGNSDKKMMSFAASTVRRVHAKFLGSGKLTFEIDAGKQGTKQLMVSKASVDDLKGILGTLDTAAKQAKARGSTMLAQEDAIALLQQRYPEQVKRQLAKLREAKGSDAPTPLKGHTRLMLVVDAAGRSVVQAGKALGKLAEESLKLTSHPRPAENNAQNYKAVCKDPTDKSIQMELRVRITPSHRFKQALWLDLELGDKMNVNTVRHAVVKQFANGDESDVHITQLAHGAIKERLASGLNLHLRSGTLNQGAEFGTRLELRWGELEARSAPLGKCDIRFWEEGSNMAAPVVVAFEMNTEP